MNRKTQSRNIGTSYFVGILSCNRNTNAKYARLKLIVSKKHAFNSNRIPQNHCCKIFARFSADSKLHGFILGKIFLHDESNIYHLLHTY